MENLGANNNSSNMGASGNGSVNLGHQGSLVGYIPQEGPMNSLLHRTEELNLRGVGSSQLSLSFSGMIHEQHFSLLNGGRLVVELNIEGPRGANNFGPSGVGGPAAVNDSSQGGQRCACGRKRKGPESEGANEIRDTDEEYCECENPPVQGTGSMNRHAGSSSQEQTTEQGQSSVGGGQTETTVATSSGDVENHGSNGAGRSRRSRRRGTPRRVITSAPEGPSGETLIHEPVTIAAVNVALPTFVSAAAPAVLSAGTPFRIRDIVARRENLLHTLFHPQTSAPVQDTTQLVEQLHHHHQPAAGTSINGLNQGQFVGPVMQSTSGANRRNPGLNIQPTGSIQPGVNSNLQRQMIRLHRATTVIEISDEENDELDGMRMDIEAMTYEQLLALGERIGAVNTGLSEEVIMERMARRYYRAAKNSAPEGAESCCICLVDFANRDVLGRINCAHKFHFDCVKQWLKVKNFCPTCKQTALPPN